MNNYQPNNENNNQIIIVPTINNLSPPSQNELDEGGNNIQNYITLIMSYNQDIVEYKCRLNESLETYFIKYAKYIKENYQSIYAIYNAEILFGEKLKKPISDIINPQNKKEKRMYLLIDKSDFENISEEEIIITLSIESIKVVKLKGNKQEKIKNIIKDSVKLDIQWCKFTYRDNEIDIDQTFNNIATDEDKKQLKIVILVNYTIPLIVNLNKKYKFQCLLGDYIVSEIEKHSNINIYEYDNYYLVYKKRKFDLYHHKKFYNIISEDYIHSFNDKSINNNIKSDAVNNKLQNTDLIVFNNKEKQMFQNNDIRERKIEINIEIIKKCCCFILIKKIPNCCEKFKRCLEKVCGTILGIICGILGCGAYIILLAAVIFIVCGWAIFFIY